MRNLAGSSNRVKRPLQAFARAMQSSERAKAIHSAALGLPVAWFLWFREEKYFVFVWNPHWSHAFCILCLASLMVNGKTFWARVFGTAAELVLAQTLLLKCSFVAYSAAVGGQIMADGSAVLLLSLVLPAIRLALRFRALAGEFTRRELTWTLSLTAIATSLLNGMGFVQHAELADIEAAHGQ